MPTADAFADAAAADGIALGPTSFDWLCEQGHIGLERVAKARRDPAIVEPVLVALGALATIFARLGGDEAVLRSARENLLLAVEHYHEPTGTIVELDGPEHFTSVRLSTLRFYPPGVDLGFDAGAYADLCREHAPASDRLSRGLAAKGFGFGGVQRERAYHDALKDLATPAMGYPPVIRIAAPDGDGAAAYAHHRDRLGAALGATARRACP